MACWLLANLVVRFFNRSDIRLLLLILLSRLGYRFPQPIQLMLSLSLNTPPRAQLEVPC